MSGPARRPLGSSGRWHFQHGPIDLVIGCEAPGALQARLIEAAWSRFQDVLEELVAELPLLKAPLPVTAHLAQNPLLGPIARRMWQAVHPHRHTWITPMAAVAGAVAEEMVAIFARPDVRRAYVNNGGDIALWLAPGQSYRLGVVADLAEVDLSCLDALARIRAEDRVCGVATSGWRGRSFSLGIADSVTVFAATASQADAAATVVANAVDVASSAVTRAPAAQLRPDSDLNERLVTVAVGELPDAAVQAALASGAAVAQALLDGRRIAAALLCLKGCARAVGGSSALPMAVSGRLRHAPGLGALA